MLVNESESTPGKTRPASSQAEVGHGSSHSPAPPAFSPHKPDSPPKSTGMPRLDTGNTHDLAVGLAPVLREMCDGNLGEIEWFRSTWQRGGAATGFSTWTLPDGSTTDVIVKLPVGPREYAWSVGLGGVERGHWNDNEATLLPVPRVVAASEAIGNHDLAWIVIERLDGPALNHDISSKTIVEICQTAAEFHALAATLFDVQGTQQEHDWKALVEQSREHLSLTTMPEVSAWRKALKKLHKCIDVVSRVWADRPRDTWCHGDLHPGNAMRRHVPVKNKTETKPSAADAQSGSEAEARNQQGRCVLLDLAFVHPGHWIEDAIYIERQFWAHPELLGSHKPVAVMKQHRKALGLPNTGDIGLLASAKRVLMAGCVPAWWDTEGSPAYARGALRVLQSHLERFT